MKFEELKNGDMFYHNQLEWMKDTNLRERVQDGSKHNGFFKNAISEEYSSAYFAPDIEVEKIEKETS